MLQPDQEYKLLEKNLKEYDFLHQLENSNNYGYIDNKLSKELTDTLSNYIYNNFDKMSDEEIKNLTLKCLSLREMKRVLLSFELTNYKEDTKECMSLDTFKNYAMKLFDRYTQKAGGFLIEDNKWTIHDDKSKFHEVRKNELLFENTINIIDSENPEINNFLEKLINRLNYIAKNITVELRFKNDNKNKIIYILIWATDNNIKLIDIESVDTPISL